MPKTHARARHGQTGRMRLPELGRGQPAGNLSQFYCIRPKSCTSRQNKQPSKNPPYGAGVEASSASSTKLVLKSLEDARIGGGDVDLITAADAFDRATNRSQQGDHGRGIGLRLDSGT